MQPGQTWQAKRELPTSHCYWMYILNTLPIDMTYTYRGLRQQTRESQVAVVNLQATLRKNHSAGAGMTIVMTGRGQRDGPGRSGNGHGASTRKLRPDITTLIVATRLPDRNDYQITGTLEVIRLRPRHQLSSSRTLVFR